MAQFPCWLCLRVPQRERPLWRLVEDEAKYPVELASLLTNGTHLFGWSEKPRGVLLPISSEQR